MTKKKTAPQEQCSASPSIEIERAIIIARARETNPGLFFYPQDIVDAANAQSESLGSKLKHCGSDFSPERILSTLISIVAEKKQSNRQRALAIQLLRRANPLISGDRFMPGLGDDGKQQLLNVYVEALEGNPEIQREAILAITDYKQNAPASIVRKLAKKMIEYMDADTQLFAFQQISSFNTDLLSLIKTDLRKLIVDADRSRNGAEIKIIGCQLLGQIRDTSEEALVTLLQLTKADEHHKVRCEAISAILQIGHPNDEVCFLVEAEEVNSLLDLLAEIGEEVRPLREELERKNKGEPLTKVPNAVKRRPAYTRDKQFLDWNQKLGYGPSKILQQWNNLSEAEREKICPNHPETVSLETVRTALGKFK